MFDSCFNTFLLSITPCCCSPDTAEGSSAPGLVSGLISSSDYSSARSAGCSSRSVICPSHFAGLCPCISLYTSNHYPSAPSISSSSGSSTSPAPYSCIHAASVSNSSLSSASSYEGNTSLFCCYHCETYAVSAAAPNPYSAPTPASSPNLCTDSGSAL